jgi:F0F1-type ATP synthase beta subunit
MSNTGKIVQVIGPVVDVQFAENAIPPIYQALTIDFDGLRQERTLTLEVQQHLGGGLARAIAMSSSEGLARYARELDTGAPISVPVGNGVLGRIFDVTGKPVDGRGPVAHFDKKYPIHRPAPALVEQDTKARSSRPASRSSTSSPLHQGRQGRRVRWRRRRQDRRHSRTHQQHRQGSRRLLRVRGRR